MRPLTRDSLPHLVRCAWELVRLRVSTALTRARARWWGIDLGPACEFYGAPLLRRLPGTRIVVGARCKFRSAVWSNLAGINRPCVLATVGEGAQLTIGEDCGFSGTVIGAAQSVTIGARVMAGVNSMISDTDWHPVDAVARASGGAGASAPVEIGDDVWLGANVLVLKGARIGAGSSIAANSVVTGEIPAGVIAGGVPARVIRTLVPNPAADPADRFDGRRSRLMCGIAGIVAVRGPVSAGDIGRMTSLIEYRGPDDHGYLGFNRDTGKARFAREAGELGGAAGETWDVLLGHRRLSILDLSEQGRCPMPSADRKLWITYNGEIYNYIELRAELSALGHHFSTGTDTEVILAAYREWGTGCLHRFNGMWAFALLDVEKATLFCARDRLGVKPFYYHWDGSTFSFGSEIKQLLALPGVTCEAHAGVLFDFLVFSTFGCNSEQTFFRDVIDMRGGHYMVVPLRAMEHWTPRPERWWNVDLRRKEEGRSDREYADRYLELFEDAVRLRLRSDVPLGTCLSGGLDSTGIVCMVDRLLHRAGVQGLQKTFTSVSDNPAFDERDYARLVIEATRVDPSFVNPTAERLLKDLDRLLWHQEEPFVSTSIFAGWCVYGLAREQGVTVTLDGQGPDEMMGGYLPTMYPALLAENVSRLRFGEAAGNVRGVHDVLGWSYGRIFRELCHEAGRGLLPTTWMPSIGRARAMLSPAFMEQGIGNSVVMRRIAEMPGWRRQAGGARFDQKLYQATFHDSLPGILRQVDRNSMAFSIEARLPFLDYRLVEFTFALPSRQKLLDGVAKQVYRRALSGVIPDAIRDRRSKLGFVTAEADWLRDGARPALTEAFAGIAGDSPYQGAYVQALYRRYLDGTSAYDPLLWKVFNLERMRANDAFRAPGLSPA